MHMNYLYLLDIDINLLLCKLAIAIVRHPEGTVLGTILPIFNIICKWPNRLRYKWKNTIAYADAAVFFDDDHWNKVEIKANLGLSKINEWYSKIVNHSKRKSVYTKFSISKANSPKHFHLKFHSNTCNRNVLNYRQENCREILRVKF